MVATQRNMTGSLYVGDLPLEVTETNLYEVFSKVGMVMSIKVCRDITTNKSLGYAYINFQIPQDAERALETMNYTPLNGKTMRIMWSQRDPALRKNGQGNVFIKNLDVNIDNRALYDTFSVFGNILSCKVVTDEANGVSKGYGFVHFESDDAAREAISRVNNMLINGKPVQVGPFVKRAQRLEEHEKTFTTVFVKGIVGSVEEDKMKAFAEKNGAVESMFLSQPHKDHATRYALISFKAHEEAVAFIDATNDKIVDGFSKADAKLFSCRALKKSDRLVEIKVRMAQANREAQMERQGRNVYVKHFDDDLTQEKFAELFTPFGTITSCVVMKDAQGRSRGFGFVCFEKKESAEQAILKLNNQTVGRRPLYVAFAQVKDQRRRDLEKAQALISRGAPFMYQNMSMPYNPFMFQNYGFPMGRMPPGMPGKMPPNMGSGFGRGQGFGTYRGGMRGGFPPMGMGRGVGPIPRGGPIISKAPPQPKYAQATMPKTSTQQALNLSELSQMSLEDQKNTLGEKLYSRIMNSHPAQAAKITGMLLEMEIAEILNVLEDNHSLTSKIDEAIAVLKAHEEKK